MKKVSIIVPVYNEEATIVRCIDSLLAQTYSLLEILVIAFAAIVLIYGGFNIMGLTMTQKTASLGVMMGQVYAVVPISGILIAIYGILNVVDLCKGYERKEEEEK